MRATRGDETDEKEDKRLGILRVNKKMAGGEMTKWIAFKIGKDETLRCDLCFKYLHDQNVHFYLNDDGATTNEVMCDACWKEDQKEEME